MEKQKKKSDEEGNARKGGIKRFRSLLVPRDKDGGFPHFDQRGCSGSRSFTAEGATTAEASLKLKGKSVKSSNRHGFE